MNNKIILNSDISENSSIFSNNTIDMISENNSSNISFSSNSFINDSSSNVSSNLYTNSSSNVSTNSTYDKSYASFPNTSSIASNNISFNASSDNPSSITPSYLSTSIESTNQTLSTHNQSISNQSISNKSISSRPTNFSSVASTFYNLTNKSNNTDFKSINMKLTNDKIFIDVAVLCQEYTNVETMCGDHIVNLDEIEISKDIFQSIFYPYGENFGLNKDYVCNNKELLPYLSFLPEFRRVNNKRFYLLEELILNIENDLNISRNCFTKESLVELTNEIFEIKSLCNINCCSVLSSLTWTNINEIIHNYKTLKDCSSEIVIILVINLIFKTPTPGVKNTLIRFQYRIIN